jgi:hypothetical protein
MNKRIIPQPSQEKLKLKNDALILLLGKISKIPSTNQKEEVQKDILLVKITYWIGAGQLHIDQEAEAANLGLTYDEVMEAHDVILATFGSTAAA